VTTVGKLKDKKWKPVGIGYLLSHFFSKNLVEKTVVFRYCDLFDTFKIVESISNYPGMEFKLVNDRNVEIKSNDRNFEFKLLKGNAKVIIGKNTDKYWSDYLALKVYPVEMIMAPLKKGFLKTIKQEFEIK